MADFNYNFGRSTEEETTGPTTSNFRTLDIEFAAGAANSLGYIDSSTLRVVHLIDSDEIPNQSYQPGGGIGAVMPAYLFPIAKPTEATLTKIGLLAKIRTGGGPNSWSDAYMEINIDWENSLVKGVVHAYNFGSASSTIISKEHVSLPDSYFDGTTNAAVTSVTYPIGSALIINGTIETNGSNEITKLPIPVFSSGFNDVVRTHYTIEHF